MDTEDSTAARCGRSRDHQKGRNRLSSVGANREPAGFEMESTQLSPGARASVFWRVRSIKDATAWRRRSAAVRLCPRAQWRKQR
jgi:hypothetical protein